LNSLGDFRAQLRVQIVRHFGEFMLAQRTEHQRLVHREHLFTELHGFGHLNHHSRAGRSSANTNRIVKTKIPTLGCVWVLSV
jgi:hypothetical protein